LTHDARGGILARIMDTSSLFTDANPGTTRTTLEAGRWGTGPARLKFGAGRD
jgi:hypothetical protein